MVAERQALSISRHSSEYLRNITAVSERTNRRFGRRERNIHAVEGTGRRKGRPPTPVVAQDVSLDAIAYQATVHPFNQAVFLLCELRFVQSR